MEYTLAYGLRRQSAAAAALWLSAALSAQAKAVSRFADGALSIAGIGYRTVSFVAKGSRAG
jgi:hypothetical protein